MNTKQVFCQLSYILRPQSELAEHPHPPLYLLWVYILGDHWKGSSILSEITPGSLAAIRTVVGNAGGPTSHSRPVENGVRSQPWWLKNPEVTIAAFQSGCPTVASIEIQGPGLLS